MNNTALAAEDVSAKTDSPSSEEDVFKFAQTWRTKLMTDVSVNLTAWLEAIENAHHAQLTLSQLLTDPPAFALKDLFQMEPIASQFNPNALKEWKESTESASARMAITWRLESASKPLNAQSKLDGTKIN